MTKSIIVLGDPDQLKDFASKAEKLGWKNRCSFNSNAENALYFNVDKDDGDSGDLQIGEFWDYEATHDNLGHDGPVFRPNHYDEALEAIKAALPKTQEANEDWKGISISAVEEIDNLRKLLKDTLPELKEYHNHCVHQVTFGAQDQRREFIDKAHQTLQKIENIEKL